MVRAGAASEDRRQMAKAFDVIIERDEEGYYVATVLELPGCHTQARSLDELNKRIKEAIVLCLQVTNEHTAKSSLEFIGLQRVAV